jgi:hypothetical protein
MDIATGQRIKTLQIFDSLVFPTILAFSVQCCRNVQDSQCAYERHSPPENMQNGGGGYTFFDLL